MSITRAARGLIRRMRDQFALAAADPEAFGRNVSQFTHRRLYEDRLLDVLATTPLRIRIDGEQSPPALNVLQPISSLLGMTGGPNTVIHVAAEIAAQGTPVRILTDRLVPTGGFAWFGNHLKEIGAASVRPSLLRIVPASDLRRPAVIGRSDIFLATHWTTARQVNDILPEMRRKFFFYLIQDYEPAFYAWSSNYALAAATYSTNYIPLVNQRFLADYLIAARIGRFSDLSDRHEVLAFEPAIDRMLFNKVPRSQTNKKKRLLFYTRPSNPRNLLGLGIIALRSVAKDASLDLEDWTFVGIGGRGSMPRIELGGGKLLEQSPWQSYTSYARYLAESEILLCLMLSPHTSYPVLEMAACGGLVVTNTFHNKTADALAQVSGNIIAVRPDIGGVVEGVTAAIRSVNKGFEGSTDINAPASWHESLSRVAPMVAQIVSHAPESSWARDLASRKNVAAVPEP